MSVDLPEPEGPITVTKSPSAMRRDASATAVTAASPVPYTLVTLSSRMMSAVTDQPPVVPPPPAGPLPPPPNPPPKARAPVPEPLEGTLLVIVAITT